MLPLGLTVVYCLNLALSNGGTKPFELYLRSFSDGSEEMGCYYTPARCTSENEFWIKRGIYLSSNERYNSGVVFSHRTVSITRGQRAGKEWFAGIISTNSALSMTINGITVPVAQLVGLDEGDQIQLKYDAMSQPLKLVYGKCSDVNKTEPAKSATINTTAFATKSPNNHLTTLQLNLAESTSFDSSMKNMTREQGDIENLEELVKVLNEEMKTLKLEIAKPHQGIGNSSGLPRLTVFTVLSVLAISFVLALNIYQGKLQSNRIKRLSLDVNRYQSKI